MSGPLLDRIDIQCGVSAVKPEELESLKPGDSSATIRERVVAAREMQAERYKGMPGVITNADAKSRDLRDICRLTEGGMKMLHDKMLSLGFSARAYDRVLRVSRTCADLDGRAEVSEVDVFAAAGYREVDRGGSGFWA